MARGKRPHYQGTYSRHSRAIRQAANANPNTRCWRCHRTLAEVQQDKPHAKWTAGHLVDGQPGGALAPECSPCNLGNGARLGNLRRSGPKRTELTW